MRSQRRLPAPTASGSEEQMNHASQPDHETPVPEGARPVHPDGEVDEPLGDPHHGSTTGAEHDGGAEQVAAESQDATTGTLDGRSPQGASEPLHGSTDGIAGAGAPVEGAGSPAEGTGASPTEGQTTVRSSPSEGLGASPTGMGAPVHEADSPSEGLGGSQSGMGSPVQEAESPAHGLGGDDERRTDRDTE